MGRKGQNRAQQAIYGRSELQFIATDEWAAALAVAIARLNRAEEFP
jgi:hypothetical protein